MNLATIDHFFTCSEMKYLHKSAHILLQFSAKAVCNTKLIVSALGHCNIPITEDKLGVAGRS